jgi:hypothetical protein
VQASDLEDVLLPEPFLRVVPINPVYGVRARASEFGRVDWSCCPIRFSDRIELFTRLARVPVLNMVGIDAARAGSDKQCSPVDNIMDDQVFSQPK